MVSEKQKIEDYKYRLNNIIRELESIEQSLINDFVNVGNKDVAKCIRCVINYYKSDIKKLEDMKNSIK